MTMFHISKCVITIDDAEPIPIQVLLNVDWESRKAVGEIMYIDMTPELEAFLKRPAPWCADESMFKVLGSALVLPDTRWNISCEKCLFTRVRESKHFSTESLRMATTWELVFETREFVAEMIT